MHQTCDSTQAYHHDLDEQQTDEDNAKQKIYGAVLYATHDT